MNALLPLEAVPCCRCGTRHGYISPRENRPVRRRINGEGKACQKCFSAWKNKECSVWQERDKELHELQDSFDEITKKIQEEKLERLRGMFKPAKQIRSVGLAPTPQNIRKIRRLWHRGEAWLLLFHPGEWGATANIGQPGEVPLRPSVLGDVSGH